MKLLASNKCIVMTITQVLAPINIVLVPNAYFCRSVAPPCEEVILLLK